MVKGLKKGVKKGGKSEVHTIQPVGGPWLPKKQPKAGSKKTKK